MPERKHSLKILNECSKNLNAPEEESGWINYSYGTSTQWSIIKLWKKTTTNKLFKKAENKNKKRMRTIFMNCYGIISRACCSSGKSKAQKGIYSTLPITQERKGYEEIFMYLLNLCNKKYRKVKTKWDWIPLRDRWNWVEGREME